MIFVDDLERCRPPRAVEVCEVASQLLGHPNVVTVLIADMATIAISAEIKYARLEEIGTSMPRSAGGWSLGLYGRLYLQKIVQIQFNLPASPAESMPRLLKGFPRPSIPTGPVESLRQLTDRIPRGPFQVAGNMLVFLLLGAAMAGPGAPDWLLFIPTALIVIQLLVLLATPVDRLIKIWRVYRTRQEQSQIDQAIHASMAAGAETVDEVMTALGDERPYWQHSELGRQRAQRILADESPHRTQAESEIKKHLPTLPRSAKRLFNHLRVLLVVAEEKRMFGGQPELQAKHLGKWAVLVERWPELGTALAVDPGRLVQLEAATSIEELSKLLGSAVPATQDLLTFLRSPTKLGPVAERLVYFQPATSDQSLEGHPGEPPGY